MVSTQTIEITRLLRDWGGGDQAALDRLAPLVYDELRRLARRYMRRENPGHTLQTTALVNEAYLRLVDVTNITWQDRAHFFAVSAQMMRRILVDAARARASGRRGGRSPRVNLDESIDAAPVRARELIALDDSLNALAQMDPRKARVVNDRPYFVQEETRIAPAFTCRRSPVSRRMGQRRHVEPAPLNGSAPFQLSPNRQNLHRDAMCYNDSDFGLNIEGTEEMEFQNA